MLALGIGATTGIFLIVEGVLLRPLPFPHPDRLVSLSDVVQGVDSSGSGEAGVTAPDIRNYVRDTQSFEELGAYEVKDYALSLTGEPAQINGARMTAGVFRTLGVRPLLGRFFTRQEDEQHQQVCLISYSLWRQYFDSDRSVLNRQIMVDRKPYLVLGVMPRDFEFPLIPGHLNRIQLWLPMRFGEQEFTSGAANWTFGMVGRLKPKITPRAAQTDAERVAQETMRNFPPFMQGLRISAVVHPLREMAVGSARPLLRLLSLAVTVVLLISCANLAGLLMVRAVRSRREMSVRLALGARSSDILRQSLLESLLLTIGGGVLGLLITIFCLPTVKTFLPESLPRVNGIGVNWVVAGFALAVALLTGCLCGLAPALAAIRTNTNEMLKEGGRTGSTGARQGLLRSSLVVTAIAIALMLLAASGLLFRSFEKMRKVDLGFRPERTLTASYALPQQQYGSQVAVDEFNHAFLEWLQRMPGVKAAGIITILPGRQNDASQVFVVEGYTPSKGTNMNLATPHQVLGDSFAALAIPLMRGRFFTPADRGRTQPVVIVNDKLAQHYWPGQNPLGKRMRVGTPDMQTPWLTVIGEVAGVKQGSPDNPTREQFYVPAEQFRGDLGSGFSSPSYIFGNRGSIVLRTSMEPDQMKNALRSTIGAIDARLPLTKLQTMEEVVKDSEGPRRFNTALVGAFAGAALLLALLGIYSIIAFAVASQAQEMAIRLALGSQRSGILLLILRSAAKLAAIGAVMGLVGTLALSRVLSSFLFEVKSYDPIVLVISVAAVMLLGLTAAAVPAGRASSINPVEALRSE